MESIIRYFIRFSQKIKEIYNKLTDQKKDVHEDDDLGAYKDPRAVIMSIASVIVVIGLVALAYSLIDSSDVELDGMNEFKRQKGVKFGVTQVKETAPQEKSIDFETRVQVSPTDICSDLHQKVIANRKLNSIEYETYKDCLRNNKIDGVNERARRIFEALANPDNDFTEKEREALINSAQGMGSEIDDLIADALMSDDPLKNQAGKALANGGLSEEDKKILQDFLKGNIPPELADAILNGTEEEKKKARSIYNDIKEGKDVTEAMKELRDMQDDRKLGQGDVDKLANALDEQLKANEKIIDDIDQQIADIDKDLSVIKDLAEKIAEKKKKGISLTPEEEAILDEYNRLLAKKEGLKKTREQVLARIQEIKSQLVALANGRFSPEEMEGLITFVRKGKKSVKEGASGIGATPEDVKNAKKVSPSEYRIIKKLAKLKRGHGFDNGLLPNVVNSEGQAVAPTLTSSVDPASLIVYPPDLRVPCVSLNYVGVSKDNMAGQRFMCQLSDNVYHPETFQIIIPKGSIAVGETIKFDSDTEMLSVKMKSIRAGKKILPFAFRVISPSGIEGVRGSVKSTKGIQITASFLMDFFSGVVQFFTNQAQIQLAQQGAGSMTFANAVAGGAYQGTSSGLNRTSEQLAQSLQNASEIYFTPAGHKLFLVPEM